MSILDDPDTDAVQKYFERLRKRDKARAEARRCPAPPVSTASTFEPLFDSESRWHTLDDKERRTRDAKHREKHPSKYPPKPTRVIVELMPDETMVTAEGRAGRAIAASPLMRLYRKGSINSEAFCVGQCLAGDLEILMGSKGWASVGEQLGLSPSRMSGQRKGMAATALSAATRVRQCQRAVGFREQFLMLTGLLEGFGTDELDRLWQQRKGNAKLVSIQSLSNIVDARVYETLKHQPSVWAEAAA